MPTRNKDTVWVGPESADGRRPSIRRNPDGEVTLGVVGSMDHPMNADSVLEVKQVAGNQYEVVSETRLTAAGPTQVATQAYRDGWSRIFGKVEVGQA